LQKNFVAVEHSQGCIPANGGAYVYVVAVLNCPDLCVEYDANSDSGVTETSD